MPVVSVIVPVYNAELHLQRCVDSLRNQTYGDLEIILVDDGSKDRSGCLCDKFAALDSRIRVLHRENAGVSTARNSGMAVASGKYLSFVDSDDYLSPDSYELLVKAATEADAELVYSDYAECYDGRVICHKSYPLGEIRRQTVENMLSAGPRGGNIWNFLLVRRDLLDREHLEFPSEFSRGEDFWFAFRCFLTSTVISRASSVYYYDSANASSLTHSHRDVTSPDYLDFLDESIGFLKERCSDTRLLVILYWRILLEKTAWAVNPSAFHLINDVHPEANDHVASCPFLGRGMKLLMTLIINRMYTPARLMSRLLRAGMNKIQTSYGHET